MCPHYAAWQNATHCSFAAWQKLLGICRQCDRVRMKKEFFADLLQVTKTVERDLRTWSDFFLKLADTHFETPYSSYTALLLVMRPTICRSNFYAAQHRTACLSQANATSTCTCGMAQLLPHFATRHSVDVP